MAKSRYGDELRQSLKEPEWRAKPTDKDYRAAERLLNDFGVTMVDGLPEFDTVIQLQNFTKNTINDYLEGLAI